MKLFKTEHILTHNGSEFAADDAIQDTTYQPFDKKFRAHFTNCISLNEALKRSWQKLKIRGLIGDQDLSRLINIDEVGKLTYSVFLNIARNARRSSTKESRKKLKKIFFNQFYASVPMKLLQDLTVVYKDDLELFHYNAIEYIK
jgi:hypothetical protein